MTDQPPAPLNAAQIAHLNKQLGDKVASIVKDVGLRQWAVEQALTHCARHNDFKELSAFFEVIYKFVSAPTAEISVIDKHQADKQQ